MAELRFWLTDWEHECCGDHRKVGDVVTVHLSFDGSVEPTDPGDEIAVNRDGSMVLVGETVDAGPSQPGWLVRFSSVEFGLPQKYWKQPSHRVRCEGKLWEERHGDPDGGPTSGVVTGRITGIRWHEAIHERTSEGSFAVSGYQPGRVIYNTDKYPGYPAPISPPLEQLRQGPNQIKGPIRYKALPPSDEPPVGWAFQFILEV